MKRGFVAAAVLALAAASAGCSLLAVTPAFLLPSPAASSAGSAVSVQPSGAALSASPSVSVSPTDSDQTATPSRAAMTSTPSPSPSPSSPSADGPFKVIADYNTVLPQGLAVSLKYDRYATPLDYFVALKGGHVYRTPTTKSIKLLSFSLGMRYRVDKLVQGADGKSKWYHVLYSDKKGTHEGYVSEASGSARSFRVGRMLDRANSLKAEADKPNTVYIMNYKNVHGLPPALPGGKTDDKNGNRRSMSAPAYEKPDGKSAFIYAPDGLLGTKITTSGGYTEVYFPSFAQARWVPTKYLSTSKDSIPNLTQLVVVDRKYQNSGTFEYANGAWRLIALTYVSTGKSGAYYQKTPLGDFMAQGKVSKFYYYYDGTQKIEGYAPWAVRFSGGGYLHGVPRKSKYDAAGHRADLPPGESLRTLGTTPKSHMCVRNYTSYAKFVYDWFKKGSCAVIVFE